MKEIIFIIGESGCGKSTLQNNLINTTTGVFKKIISVTSRSPRIGEINGEDYYFVTKEEFERLLSNGEILQHDKVGEEYYGTKISEYEADVLMGLFVCTPKGVLDTVKALREYNIDINATIIFFSTTNDLLMKHNVDLARINRANIRLDFYDRFFKNDFDGIALKVIQDHDVGCDLHRMVYDFLLQVYNHNSRKYLKRFISGH